MFRLRERFCRIESLELRRLLASDLAGQLVINEFVSSNDTSLETQVRSTIESAFGSEVQAPDWIEIRNLTADAISLDGVFLSDSLSSWDKWQFPADASIPGDGYLVVFASGLDLVDSGLDINGFYHTNFKLSADGEPLTLRDANGEIIHELSEVPAQLTDVSYGISSSNAVGYLRETTPGTANGEVYLGVISSPEVSVPRGFYDTPLTVSIVVDPIDAEIRYTTDGSEPTVDHGDIYVDPVQINTTTTLRIGAFKTDYLSPASETFTYLFVSDVINQTAQIPGFPFGGSVSVGGSASVPQDQEMDPNITTAPEYVNIMDDALLAIPTMSITSNQADIFSDQGWYDGESVEKPVSIEILYPSNPASNQQVNAGIESHSHNRLKRSLRLSFKSEYGPSTFETDFFQQTPGEVNSQTVNVNSIVLRAGNNRSWARIFNPGSTTYTIDEFYRTSQIAMSDYGMKGGFVHLYINGVYWGLYNPVARADDEWNAEQFGGAAEDWYTFNHGGDLSGDPVRMNYFMDTVVEKDMSQLENYLELQSYLDTDAFADYIILAIYTSLQDWPKNNFYGALRNDTSELGASLLRFMAWDGEWSWSEGFEPGFSVTGRATIPSALVSSAPPPNSAIAKIWHSVRTSPEFLTAFADRVNLHLFNGGALSNEVALQRWEDLNNYVREAVVAESARWGDSLETLGYPTRTRDDDWQSQYNWMVSLITGNDQYLIDAARADGLYPNLDAPELSQFGGVVDQLVTIINPNSEGTIYYTLDGSDPRESGGTISSNAIVLSSGTEVPFLPGASTLSARIWSNETWSAITRASFTKPAPFEFVISELMYNPPASTAAEVAAGFTNQDRFEFVEITNTGTIPVPLNGYSFSSGIEFTFPNVILDVGQRGVVVSKTADFQFRYGTDATVLGEFAAGKLANGGELVEISDPLGQVVVSVDFQDGPLWPIAADGAGASLELRNETTDAQELSKHYAWQSSANWGGSPGLPASVHEPVLIDRVTVTTSMDSITLVNQSSQAIDVSGWYLSDDESLLGKFSIPANTLISAGESWTATSTLFNPTPESPEPNHFDLSPFGGQIWLSKPNSSHLEFVDNATYSAIPEDTAFVRLPATTAILTPETGIPSDNGMFSVFLSEVHYHPAPLQTSTLDLLPSAGLSDFEYVKIHNSTANSVDISSWQLTGGIEFTFPSGTILPGNTSVLVASLDPTTNPEWETAFRNEYSLHGDISIVGGWTGSLSNSEDQLELQTPEFVDPSQPTVTSFVTVDAILYSDSGTWPISADGFGHSLHRVLPAQIGTDYSQWHASLPNPSSNGGITGQLSQTITQNETDLITGQLLVFGNETATFSAVGPVQGLFGEFTLLTSGEWQYQLDLLSAQSLPRDATGIDSFDVSADGGLGFATVRIQVIGLNDPANIGGDISGTVNEDQTAPLLGRLAVFDPDSGESAFQPQSALPGDFGVFDIAADGSWIYTLTNDSVQFLRTGETEFDSFTVTTVGGDTAQVTIQIDGMDEPNQGLSVLFVAASSAPQGYEVTLVNHLSDQGHTVSVLDDSLATSNSADGFDLIYISETVYSGAVGSKFTSLSIPIIVAESWLFDDLHMTSNQSNQYGAVTSNGVHVVDLGHSLAQGLSQANFNLYTSVANVGWGIPLPQAVIAHLASDPTKATIFAYQAGDLLADGSVAPAARIGLSIWSNPTSEVLTVLDNAVLWAT
ncbi:MAG: lamin tail domain-containing protein, partial [Planctomycetales bacterium]|nr:lamin tail domain-containing protein [Planctomycetales bacterium]